MDRLEKGITAETRIRVTVADCTMAAKALEARHLSGPVAAQALAEGLVGVALLSADAATDDEAWMLRVHAKGPLEGLLVEATGAGHLRGFTNRKILPGLDEREPVDTEEAWGPSGSVQIVSTRPGRILNQAVLQVNPPHIHTVLARYFTSSMQIPTGCAIVVRADDGGVLSARGLLAQKMPDSDTDAFIEVLEAMEEKRVEACLATRSVPENLEPVLAVLPGMAGWKVREQRPLAFRCRCTKERVLRVLTTLEDAELEEMIGQQKVQDVTCHMCGENYRAHVEDLKAVLAANRKSRASG